jgi:transposase
MLRTYRYRLYPTREQAVALNAQLAACCDLYNAALEVKVTRAADGCRWYVSIGVELAEPAERPRHPRADAAVGIDLGVRDFAALSTGERIAGPGASKHNAAAVRRAARKVARRERGSNRRRKAVALLARHRAREANRRRNAAQAILAQTGIDRPGWGRQTRTAALAAVV